MEELKNKSAAELNERLTELQKEFVDAKRAHKMGELKNTRKPSQLRKQIARIKTLKNQSSNIIEEKK